MKKKIKAFIVSTIILMIGVPTTFYILTVFFQYKCKMFYKEATDNFQIAYAYDFTASTLNQSLYSTNRKGGEQLYDYYRKLYKYYGDVQSGKIVRKKVYSNIIEDSVYQDPYFIPVPLNHIGVEQKIYIESINVRDSVVKGYVFNTSCWGYFEGFFAINTIYDKPPADSLIINLYEHNEKYASEPKPGFGSPSPYGFYCN